MTIDRTAAEGFSAGAASYQRARPDYPDEAVAFLAERFGIVAGKRLVDLGAGTGKFTSCLTATGARIVAVEPVEDMRGRIDAGASVHVVGGTAETIPLRDGCADAVVAAQAFHWFDGPRALAEMHRILVPGGGLGLVWNARDRSSAWVAEMSDIVDQYGNAIRRHETEEWRDAFDGATGFSPLEMTPFPNPQEVDEDQVLDRVASTSFIAILPDDERSGVLDRVRALVRSHPDTRGRKRFTFAHETRVYTAVKF
ncbi:MAG: methyltransferase domain-containing protein [Actinomycetota bacterium]